MSAFNNKLGHTMKKPDKDGKFNAPSLPE